MEPKLDAYLERLRAVPFVRAASVEKEELQVGKHRVDALVVIRTPTGKEKVYVEGRTSSMSREMAAQAVTVARDVQPLIVAAPVIGAGMGDFLTDNHTSFVDLRGNCHIDLGGRYLARTQGQARERPTSARALRTPSYQVLFTRWTSKQGVIVDALPAAPASLAEGRLVTQCSPGASASRRAPPWWRPGSRRS